MRVDITQQTFIHGIVRVCVIRMAHDVFHVSYRHEISLLRNFLDEVHSSNRTIDFHILPGYILLELSEVDVAKGVDII